MINRNYYSGGGGVAIVPSIGFGYSPFGYSPFGGFGTGYALGALGSSGARVDNYRLENEVIKSLMIK